MTETNTAALTGGVALLERAINYTLGSLVLVTPAAMSRPTPCRDWDLRSLLAHMNDSLAALSEVLDLGHIDMEISADADPGMDPVAALRNRARRLLGEWTSAERDDWVSVAGCPMTASVVLSTGAIEITAHGWDVAEACGHNRPIPVPFAAELLPLASLFVTDADRPTRFGPRVAVSPLDSPGNKLIAFLGRVPH